MFFQRPVFCLFLCSVIHLCCSSCPHKVPLLSPTMVCNPSIRLAGPPPSFPKAALAFDGKTEVSTITLPKPTTQLLLFPLPASLWTTSNSLFSESLPGAPGQHPLHWSSFSPGTRKEMGVGQPSLSLTFPVLPVFPTPSNSALWLMNTHFPRDMWQLEQSATQGET